MTLVEITGVELHRVNPQVLEGFFVDGPKCGDRLSTGVVRIIGWVLGGECPAVGVEVATSHGVVGRNSLCMNRPDVAAAFPRNRSAHLSGFVVSASLAGMAPLELELRAVLGDGTRVPIARIQARRPWTANTSAIGCPLVSVVIPCYQTSRFLASAIESVLSQTYPHFEIVVVDDGSPDNAAAVAERFPGIRYVRQPTAGVSGARNTGLRHSRGSIVVFLDADDRLLPDALEVGLTELSADPACAAVAGECRLIAFDGAPVASTIWARKTRDDYAELLRNCFLFTPAIMYRRTVFESIGGFDESFTTSEDHELYFRVARQFRIRCHQHVVAEYRRHGGNATRAAGTNLRNRLRVLKAQRRYVIRHGWRYYASYREGLRFGRRYYGDPLINEILNCVWRRRWHHALKGLGVLLRYDSLRLPTALMLLLRCRPERAALPASQQK